MDTEAFSLDLFKEAAKAHEGEHYFRNVCTVNLREPDRKGYIRTIDQVTVNDEQSQSLSGYRIRDISLEIKARSFLQHQIRILVMNLLKMSMTSYVG